MTHTIRGLVPILATPFTSEGQLDIPSLRRLATFTVESGASGVAVSGMASEAFALTAGEREKVLRTVVEVVDGACPVVCGINATSTVTAIEQAQEAAEAGASCLMVLPPYMVKPTAAQILEFYADVAASTPAEIMIQDAPGPTGVQMSVQTITELSKIPGVTSVKVEAPPTAEKVTAVVQASASEEFAVLGGNNAQLCLEEYAGGAIGTMPACEFTDLLAPILESWHAGEERSARRDFAALMPLLLFGVQPGLAWAVHKEILVKRGIIATSTVRSPAGPLQATTRTALLSMIENLDCEMPAFRP
ncbi:dihydrodipicolinate synthase family protein [Arthrobacter rhombi]|uniref:dihydrodipicolinate synthase family protein n=1 Tax=Arthrobacter rhombi TaxID=71253 RepID=UPI0031E1655D